MQGHQARFRNCFSLNIFPIFSPSGPPLKEKAVHFSLILSIVRANTRSFSNIFICCESESQSGKKTEKTSKNRKQKEKNSLFLTLHNGKGDPTKPQQPQILISLCYFTSGRGFEITEERGWAKNNKKNWGRVGRNIRKIGFSYSTAMNGVQ